VSNSLPSVNQPVKRTSRRLRGTGASRLIKPIRKTRVADEVAERIRVLILNGTLRRDEPLPSERELAERFDVSRGSIRDAFRRLEMIGLLETRHGQGTFPRELSLSNLITPLASVLTHSRDLQDELMDVRRMFEPAVARVAATRVTAAEIDELERILQTQERKLKAGQSTIAEDTAFHSALAHATHNRVVVHLMETLNDLLIGSRKLSLRQRGRPSRSVRGHEGVVAALRGRDPEGAARAMRDHIDQIAELVSRAQQAGGGETS
jgi:GntR family transcriptional repressor for pyruvate dehydrogenase complex